MHIKVGFGQWATFRVPTFAAQPNFMETYNALIKCSCLSLRPTPASPHHRPIVRSWEGTSSGELKYPDDGSSFYVCLAIVHPLEAALIAVYINNHMSESVWGTGPADRGSWYDSGSSTVLYYCSIVAAGVKRG